MSRRELLQKEIEQWAIFDLDNDNNLLEEYYKKLDSLTDEELDNEYEATVGEWKESLDD